MIKYYKYVPKKQCIKEHKYTESTNENKFSKKLFCFKNLPNVFSKLENHLLFSRTENYFEEQFSDMPFKLLGNGLTLYIKLTSRCEKTVVNTNLKRTTSLIVQN